MSDVAIRVDGLTKTYRIGVRDEDPANRAEAFGRTLAAPFSYLRQMRRPPTEEETLYALLNVSFAVQTGEVLGIIGRNGAGKSTLLKVLSRITEPTSGRIELHGRVGSLLEVGTGFHPELTGRENIFLNGALLGMRRTEVRRKFDEIVAFSGVERFLDTPVKRYSSGMYVRLAFAVAAHLEPEILLVDEVLAVGDGDFQKKCLGKVQEVASHGRTVLFVSHNMGMITSLCNTAILLEDSRIAAEGPAAEVVARYGQGVGNTAFQVDFTRKVQLVGDELGTLLEAWVEDSEGQVTGSVDLRQPFAVRMRYAVRHAVPLAPYPNFHFYDTNGVCAFVTAGHAVADRSGDAGEFVATCHVPGQLLNNGTYYIGLALTFRHLGIHVSFFERDALAVHVVDPIDQTLDDERLGYSGAVPGVFRPRLPWTVEPVA